MPGMYSAPFFNAKNLLERQSLGKFLGELDALSGPLAGPAKPPELVKFSTTDTVGHAVRQLAAYNVLAAPVSDAASGEYVGMIDVADLLKGLIRGVYPELLEQDYLKTHKRLSISELQSVGVEFTAKNLSSLLHGGDLWYKGDAESNLLEVVESGFRVGIPAKLHSPHHHLRVHHRVAVFDILPGEQTPDGPIPEWRITDIISQTDVVRFLLANIDRLDSAFARSIKDLGLVQGAVNSVTADTPALSVFALMHKRQLSGIAITETPNGPLVGNLSMSDLRGLTPDRFGALALPIGAFVLLQNKRGISWEDVLLDNLPPAIKEGRWAEVLSALPLVTATPDTPLRQVIESLVEYRKHRVWVVDAEGKACGVVTPTDLLRLVIS